MVEPLTLKRLRSQFKSRRKRLAKEVFERDGKACAVCSSTLEVVVDHVVPLSRGGTNDLSNLQPLCWDCNLSKGSLLPSEWKERS